MNGKGKSGQIHWRHRLHEVIFEADTPAGRAFDVILMLCIILSVIVVMLDSVRGLNEPYGPVFYALEWIFTFLFTIEYLLRLFCIGSPLKYAASFFGVIDLLAILPSYVSLLFPGSQYLLVIRILRVLRVFRVLKLVKYLSEADMLIRALRASRRKIFVFLFVVASLVVIIGSMMYMIEGEEHGFSSIPISIYWAIVTLTTVGYGDISPQTTLGRVVAAFVMICGYAIIAVPTGIVTAEIAHTSRKTVSTQVCPQCSAEGHDADAKHCKYCGAKM